MLRPYDKIFRVARQQTIEGITSSSGVLKIKIFFKNDPVFRIMKCHGVGSDYSVLSYDDIQCRGRHPKNK